MIKCDSECCTEKAEFRDEMENPLCENHMHQDMEEWGLSPDDFERITDKEHGIT